MNRHPFRSTVFIAAIAAVVSGIVASPGVAAAERVSVSSGGSQGNGQSRYPSISWNGRHVTFESDATNLVAGDSNAANDVFVHDRWTGSTSRISLTSTGAQSGAASGGATISGEGSRIVFSSYGDLLPTSGYHNCYLLDRSANTLQILDTRADNGQPGSGVCEDVSIDVSGERVAFSTHTEVVAGDTNGQADVFVRDLGAGTVQRVNLGPGNVQANQNSSNPRISGDGSVVLFASAASNLVSGDSNNAQDLFLAPAAGGGVIRVNLGPGHAQTSNTPALTDALAALNADGSLIAFSSNAQNLPDWDEFAESTLYVRAPGEDVTVAVSLPLSPELQREGFNSEPDFSWSGQYLVFASTDDLLPDAVDPETTGGIYVIDIVNAWVARVSVGGHTGNVYQPRISADGSGVVWFSNSSTQVPGDTNGTWDVFYADNPIWIEPPIFADGFDGT
jgi:Tol biopolymer transport system component